MKKKLYSILFIVMINMALVACGNEPKTASDEMKEDVAAVETTDETATTPETEESEAIEESETETEKAEETEEEAAQTEAESDAKDNELSDAYKKILDSTYEILTTDTSDYTWQDGEMGIAEVTHGDDVGATLAGVGYCLLDLDENGIDELIICEKNGDEPSRILSMYTLNDREAVLLVEGWFRNRYYVLSDNRIYNEGSGGAAYTIFGTYHMAQDGMALELESYIFSDYEDMNDMSTLSWFKSTQESGDTANSEKMEFEDENEPYNMMEEYLADCKKLDLIMFSDYK